MERLFARFHHLDTRINRWLVAHSIQYIIKDVVLAAGMVIAAIRTGARIVAEPQSMRSTLRTRIPGVAGKLRPEAPQQVNLEH
ncbi:MAG: hypothetical protein M3R24_05330 [Chloroflexota bacterium]|nr:hypothetical protein [Chloroflexota bacterium]